MDTSSKRKNKSNDPDVIPKDPINIANVRNHVAKVNNLYK
jgi:hypothetical protein